MLWNNGTLLKTLTSTNSLLTESTASVWIHLILSLFILSISLIIPKLTELNNSSGESIAITNSPGFILDETPNCKVGRFNMNYMIHIMNYDLSYIIIIMFSATRFTLNNKDPSDLSILLLAVIIYDISKSAVFLQSNTNIHVDIKYKVYKYKICQIFSRYIINVI